MESADEHKVLVRVSASRGRLTAGTGLQILLGALLVWIAMARPPADVGWRLFLLAVGILALWSAIRTWRAGQLSLELTRAALRDSAGTELCRIDEIRRVDRGVFAFKPARGFALLLVRSRRRAWVPGLWWRVGRRIGVGGTTAAAETRLMAEIIDELLAERQGRTDRP